MSTNYISYIDINEIVRGIKETHKLRPIEEVNAIILNSINEGFRFEGQLIKAVANEFYNPLASKQGNWFHFLCPKCSKKAKKLYILNNRDVMCRGCSKIRNKTRVNTQADRIVRIQKYITEIFKNRGLSSKQKNRMIKFIVTHYNALDSKYKMAYNTFVFKHIQNWCLDILQDKEKSSEYKKAIRDVLGVLRDSKKILSKTDLIKTKYEV
jgi:hypothetical protein